jgi:predicted dehydrogenase
MMKVGLVGLGDAGFNMHLPALKAIAGATVSGIADIDAARLKRATTVYGGTGYSDWRDMLSREAPDCVIVATPPDSHAVICLAALEGGANVVCEKPFTDTVADADRIIAAAAQSGRRIAINHEFREMPIFQGVLKSAASEGGDAIVFAQAWQQVDLPPTGDTGWRGSMQRRVLHEAGVHLIDFVLSAFGSVPETVFAAFSDGGTSAPGNDDAVVSMSLRFPGARLANITINRLAKGENHYLDARIDTRTASYRASFGGRARLTAGLHRAKQPHLRLDYGVSGLAWKEIGSRREVIARNPPDPRMLATRSLHSRTFEAFDSGGDVPCSAEWAREVTRVIEAAYRSGESGRVEVVERPAG